MVYKVLKDSSPHAEWDMRMHACYVRFLASYPILNVSTSIQPSRRIVCTDDHSTLQGQSTAHDSTAHSECEAPHSTAQHTTLRLQSKRIALLSAPTCSSPTWWLR